MKLLPARSYCDTHPAPFAMRLSARSEESYDEEDYASAITLLNEVIALRPGYKDGKALLMLGNENHTTAAPMMTPITIFNIFNLPFSRNAEETGCIGVSFLV